MVCVGLAVGDEAVVGMLAVSHWKQRTRRSIQVCTVPPGAEAQRGRRHGCAEVVTACIRIM
jgi:hypothetical protein